jgi:hypothetical protein
MKAVEVLMEHGVPEERIIFINLVRFLVPLSTHDELHAHL